MEAAIQSMQAAAAEMRGETIILKEEPPEMEAAAEDKKNEVEFEKMTRDQLLAELVLMLDAEQALLETLFPPN